MNKTVVYLILKNGEKVTEVNSTKYDINDVKGVFVQFANGEARILAPKFLIDQELLDCSVIWFGNNTTCIDALNMFNGKETTAELKTMDSPAVCNVANMYGDDWFIPSVGELTNLLYNVEEINKFLDMVNGADKLNVKELYWTSTRYSLTAAFVYRGWGDICSYYSYDLHNVLPITLPEVEDYLTSKHDDTVKDYNSYIEIEISGVKIKCSSAKHIEISGDGKTITIK